MGKNMVGCVHQEQDVVTIQERNISGTFVMVQLYDIQVVSLPKLDP